MSCENRAYEIPHFSKDTPGDSGVSPLILRFFDIRRPLLGRGVGLRVEAAPTMPSSRNLQPHTLHPSS
jgi:hypothetical protein